MSAPAVTRWIGWTAVTGLLVVGCGGSAFEAGPGSGGSTDGATSSTTGAGGNGTTTAAGGHTGQGGATTGSTTGGSGGFGGFGGFGGTPSGGHGGTTGGNGGYGGFGGYGGHGGTTGGFGGHGGQGGASSKDGGAADSGDGGPFDSGVQDAGWTDAGDGGYKVDGGKLFCATKQAELANLLAAAQACDPKNPTACQTSVDGICCPAAVASAGSQATLDYLAARNAFKDAGCNANCPLVPCVGPSHNCVPDPDGNGGCQ